MINAVRGRRLNVPRASFYYGSTVGNELGMSDPVFMKKHAMELEQDSGKWIDSSVWHGKAHTWEKIKWLIGEVRLRFPGAQHSDHTRLIFVTTVEPHLWRTPVCDQRYPMCCGCSQGVRGRVPGHRRYEPCRTPGRRRRRQPRSPPRDCGSRGRQYVMVPCAYVCDR